MLAFQILIDGFAVSALYALGAIGFTLIFCVPGVLHLSHGPLQAAAAVTAWAAHACSHVGLCAGAALASCEPAQQPDAVGHMDDEGEQPSDGGRCRPAQPRGDAKR